MTIAKSWTFTKNHYVDADVEFFKDWPDFSYMVFGFEVAPTTGTPHLQGYFTLQKAVRPSYLKKTLPHGTHFEVARQSGLANFRYCTKSQDYIVVDRRHKRGGKPTTLAQTTAPKRKRKYKISSPIESHIMKILPNLDLT